MLRTLHHRGPDERAYIKRGTSVLGHNRLAIVGLQDPRSRQPYVAQDGNSVSIFNGEIFNYKSIYTDSCSEIEVINRLMASQTDLGQVLNGYYAVCHLDVSRNQVFLARDTFGVMPLYYTLNPFEVASEKKCFHGEQKVYEVLPGTKVVFDLKTRRSKIQKYSLPYFFAGQSEAEPQVLSRITDSFLSAVGRVLKHSEVGFSLALSGGLDSSLLLLAVKILGMYPENIVSTFVQETDTSEIDRAVDLVSLLGWSSLHTIVRLEPMGKPELRYWIETPQNPIRDFAFQRHATVAKHSRSKVLICGEGADELGLGYPQNRQIDTGVSRYLRRISWLKKQHAMTLDRVNKAGMMYSKEYRVPYLDIEFVLDCLRVDMLPGKPLFRRVAEALGMPHSIVDCAKYSEEEALGRQT
jgi:asparagine synthase (glutamine-hydrolysing)